MSNTVIVGAQWGDEGKGKVVDLYTEAADVVVRYSGGANAGHTLVVNGKKIVTHVVPSGIAHPEVLCLLGMGMVVGAKSFLDEVVELGQGGLRVDPDRLAIAAAAHLVVPTHQFLDQQSERSRNGGALGTTGRGIGPCYADKAARRGIRLGLMKDPPKFEKAVRALLEEHVHCLDRLYNFTTPNNVEEMVDEQLRLADRVAPYVVNSGQLVTKAMKAGKRILFEGAQGAGLDIDSGTYPYVTSSSTGLSWVMQYVGHRQIGEVIGVTKAYTTRVGAGPFPTEMTGEEQGLGNKLRESGGEYGATTGRPRCCGWLDLVALVEAIRRSGITQLALTKIDVLSDWKEVKVCVAYELDGERITEFPAEWGANVMARCHPIYETLTGWAMKKGDPKHLPSAAVGYIRFIEKYLEQALGYPVPIVFVGTGPGREQYITLRDR